jgi:zinc protease
VQRLFGPIPISHAPPPPVDAEEPEQDGERIITVRKPAELPAIMLGYRGVTVLDPDRPALDVAARILAGGESSRLPLDLVRTHEVATSVASDLRWGIDRELFMIYAQAKPGKTADEMVRRIDDGVAALARGPVTPEELARARRLLRMEMVKGLKTDSGRGEPARVLRGGPGRLPQAVRPRGRLGCGHRRRRAASDEARISCRRSARRSCSSRTRRARRCPGNPTAPSLPRCSAVAHPLAARAADVVLPPVTRVTLENGLRVIVAEAHEVPLVEFYTMVGAGSAQDPAGKEGLASLTADLLTRGAGKLSAEDFARTVESLGGSIAADAGTDGTIVSGEFLRDDFPTGLDLLRQVLREPTFAPDEVRRARDAQLAI